MIARVIAWSIRNRILVLLGTAAIIGAGLWSVRTTPLDAIPDLSDVQVIVQTDFAEQAPQIVEDQVTYPIASEMLKVPGARVVRAFSFFGLSLVYVIFEDGTDIYWARSRVLEYLNGIRRQLPENVEPVLGPDATGVGWVYEYTLESDSLDLAELRTLQDWYIRYQLTAVPGVAEVASLGGFVKQYQVEVNPERLRAFDIPVTRVSQAIGDHNIDIGARVLEMGGREYMIRGLGYLRGTVDIENVAVGSTPNGTPIRVADVATVQEGPAPRRGVADLDGRGEVVAGIVVMRFGSDALETIERVKERLEEINAGAARRDPAAAGLRPERPHPPGDRHAARETRGGIAHRRGRGADLPAPLPLGARRDRDAAPRHPHLVHRHALDRRERQHHEPRRDRDRDRGDGGRGHRHGREHAQTSRARGTRHIPLGRGPREREGRWVRPSSSPSSSSRSASFRCSRSSSRRAGCSSPSRLPRRSPWRGPRSSRSRWCPCSWGISCAGGSVRSGPTR